MRAFYYLFILFNNLLSIHIYKCGGKFGGLAPKPLMSAAYDVKLHFYQINNIQIDQNLTTLLQKLKGILLKVFIETHAAYVVKW